MRKLSPTTENLISEKQQNPERICERHGVSSLALFGSAVSEDFNPDKSDLDFAVEFKPMAPIEHKNAYFGIISDLENWSGARQIWSKLGPRRTHTSERASKPSKRPCMPLRDRWV